MRIKIKKVWTCCVVYGFFSNNNFLVSKFIITIILLLLIKCIGRTHLSSDTMCIT